MLQHRCEHCEGRRRMRRSTISLVTIIATAFGILSLGRVQPASATAGEICMFNAPSGAELLPGVGAGHVGWGFLSGGSTWIFGATEGAGQVWQTSGSWDTMLNTFGSGTNFSKGPGYYTQYRCASVSSSQPTLAYNTALNQASRQYNLYTDNCLTRAVEIFDAYGATDLPSATSTPPEDTPPNIYYGSLLPQSFAGSVALPTKLTVTVLLDDPTTHRAINPNPLHKSRPLSIQIFNASNVKVFDNSSSPATATLVPGTGDRYAATVTLPGTWPANAQAAPAYLVKARLDYTLVALAPGIVLIQGGMANSTPAISLIVGDINQDNSLNLTDYNLLMNCYSDLQPPRGPCSAQDKRAADLNDDGAVNGIDYNYYLKEVLNVSGQ